MTNKENGQHKISIFYFSSQLAYKTFSNLQRRKNEKWLHVIVANT
jgi:hypothetical protein